MAAQALRKDLGSQGEELAADFLLKKGYRIHVRNLRLLMGEIDLVCLDGDTVVAVEVKTQTKVDFSHPVFKVDSVKRRKLAQLAKVLEVRYPNKNIRVDVVTVAWGKSGGKPRVVHLENVLE